MNHSQNKGSAISQAMAGSAQENAAYAVFGRRVMHDRDDDRAARASKRYAELRLLKKEELLPIARPHGGSQGMGRQVLIALIIDGELLSGPSAAKIGPSTTKEES